MKLKAIRFTDKKFRKLKDLELIFSDRITAIGGLNGIGKSTILGLIANASGLNNPVKSYFNKNFQAKFQEIFHLDENDDYVNNGGAFFFIDYEINGKIFTKKCNVSKHKDGDNVRLKIVPRTLIEHKVLGKEFDIGQDAKVTIPTIYLGMSRMVPMGEHGADQIDIKKIRNLPQEDMNYLYSLYNETKVVDYDLKDEKLICDYKLIHSQKSIKLPTLDLLRKYCQSR